MPIEEAIALRESRVAALRPVLAALPVGDRTVTLEIGCGHGHFLTAYAAAHPGEFCLGVDLVPERLERAARKARRAGLANVAWIRAAADHLMAAWPDALEIRGTVFILFPDPWPKRRHWKNRLIRADFLSALARRAAPGVRLCLRTDHLPYFEEASTAVDAHPEWESDPAARWAFEKPTVFQQRAAAYHSLVAVRRRPD